MYQMVPCNNNGHMINSQSYVPYANTCTNFMNMHINKENMNQNGHFNSNFQFPQQHTMYHHAPMKIDSNPTPDSYSCHAQFPTDIEFGAESPESMSMSTISNASPSVSPSKQDSIEMKEEQCESKKDPQDLDLTYDEITALLGPNTQITDFLTQLFEEETNQESGFCKFNAKNEKFLDRRLTVLNSMNTAVKNCKIDAMTGDKAMYYFDKLCAKTEVDKNCFDFAAFICLWIVCKYNETANTMPHINTLIDSYPNNKSFKNYSMKDITSAEKKIISSLAFRLKCVLPIDFIEYYLNVSPSPSKYENECCLFPNDLGYDEMSKKLVPIPVGIKKDIDVYSRFFLDMAKENYKLCTTYKPSEIAIAAINCARRAVKIVPYFNKDYMLDMFKIDGISKEIGQCFNELWADYKNKFPNHAEGHKDFQTKSLIEMFHDQ